MDETSHATASHRGPEVRAEAPARVNLIGEHTDYAQGLVLPLPLTLHTRVALRRRTDSRVVARTTLGQGEEGAYQLGEERRGRGWLDYVQGLTAALRLRGFSLGGVELDVASDIPAGGGLASSAALGVAVMRALWTAFTLPLDRLEVARLVQAAERDFVGAPVGLMDPLSASFGTPGRALFIDIRSLAMEDVQLPAGLEVGVLHSGISHRNASGTYAQRRQEADAAAQALGVASLREVSEEALAAIAALPPPLDRRARHIVTENARVLAFVAALRARELGALGPLLEASHRSLRDDYQVSHPDVDVLVALAQAEPDVLGARMTGGGCGGAVLFLSAAGRARTVGTRIEEAYRRKTGRSGALLIPALDG